MLPTVMILSTYAITDKYRITDNIFFPNSTHHAFCSSCTESSKGKKNILISENNDINKNNYCLITMLPSYNL